jgi:hypothetical protein
VQTHVDLKFADGEYRFALGLAQIHELQTKCGTGIGAIYARVVQGRVTDDIGVGHPAYAAYHLEDLRETIRHGLIGGGEGVVDGLPVKVSPLRANELVERYLEDMPLAEQWNLAAAILYAKIEGYVPADGSDKKKARRSAKRPAATDGLTTQAH